MNSNVTMKQESKPRQLAELGEASSQRCHRSFGSTARAASGVLTAPPHCRHLAIGAVFPSPHPMGRRDRR
jgi:hypothetical protein